MAPAHGIQQSWQLLILHHIRQVTKLCDLATDEPADSICSVAWSQRGSYLAVGTDKGGVQLWDVAKSTKCA